MARGERGGPAVGDRVRVSSDDPDEFRRVPAYLRGQVGEVVGVCGARPLPVGRHGREGPGEPEPVLTVRFPAAAVFGPKGRGVTLHADLWVSNLEPVNPAGAA